MSLLGWGGSPYPHCRCGHDRMAHIGHQPKGRGTTLELKRREGGCSEVVGTGWCSCSSYRPETEPLRISTPSHYDPVPSGRSTSASEASDA